MLALDYNFDKLIETGTDHGFRMPLFEKRNVYAKRTT
jgi:hypothetical protein